ncbi:hypothetical protein D3C72_1575620 [compost metagenome]
MQQKGRPQGLPARLLGVAERIRKIARPVAEQQLLQPLVVKPGFGQCQLLRMHGGELVQAPAVGLTDEAAVQILVHIHVLQGWALEHGGPGGAHVRQITGNGGVLQGALHVDVPARGLLGAQGAQAADDHGRFVQVHGLDRQALHAFGQLGAGREHAQADVFD